MGDDVVYWSRIWSGPHASFSQHLINGFTRTMSILQSYCRLKAVRTSWWLQQRESSWLGADSEQGKISTQGLGSSHKPEATNWLGLWLLLVLLYLTQGAKRPTPTQSTCLCYDHDNEASKCVYLAPDPSLNAPLLHFIHQVLTLFWFSVFSWCIFRFSFLDLRSKPKKWQINGNLFIFFILFHHPWSTVITVKYIEYYI